MKRILLAAAALCLVLSAIGLSGTGSKTAPPDVQIDSEARNPWTNENLLQTFIDLNNRVLDRFTPEERVNIGIHTCPAGTWTRCIAPRSTTPSCCRRCSR